MITPAVILTVAVTVSLFIAAQALMMFRWMNKSSNALTSMAVRFEERTRAIADDLKKVNRSLEMLATADVRISTAEKLLLDHEARLRALESE